MITVLGSLNMDIVATIDRYPAHGETRFGKDVSMLTGGKGANQAFTCGRFGGETALIGAVGDDAFGRRLIDRLASVSVATDYILVDAESSTGTVVVTVDDSAENTMIVIKGANDRLTRSHIDRCRERIAASKVLLVQMEMQHDVVAYAMDIAREHGVYVILDPAPAAGVTVDILKRADLITPNKQETMYFTGIEVVDERSAIEAARMLHGLGVGRSIVKMAEQGSVLYDNGHTVRIEGIPVRPVDTVGAGDSFAGALAVALSDGASLEDAVRFATAVSALKVTKPGAQDGVPTRDELIAFCRERNLPLYFNKSKAV